MSKIQNPILRGFNPDPSIIRVDDDYYIATSTFEWFPGVQIHHSKDLQHWQLVTRPLNRVSQLDMLGNPDSCGVWAPCLTYDNGIFYLVYSNVRSFDGVWKDTPNYLVTTDDILGEWSEPIFLSSSGFDGSLFHDDDGKKYFTSMIVDHRGGKFFGGIELQEYDPAQKKLVGPVHHIFDGTDLGVTEGPHIYKLNDWYYLLTAEGGTEYGHAVTFARSKSLIGPYEVHPENPIISARDNQHAPLQKTGHADFVQTQSGEWYGVFLVGRPLTTHGRCTLGRETAIEKLEWRDDDWLYMSHGSREPRIEVPAPDLAKHTFDPDAMRDDFNKEKLNIHYQALRVPISDDWASLTARQGYLRLFGRESLSSFHRQSLLARRVQHFNFEAATCLEYEPTTFQQMAGLVCYYNSYHWIYLCVSANSDGSQKLLNIYLCDKFNISEPLTQPCDVSGAEIISLKVHWNLDKLQFFYATELQEDWLPCGPQLDASILSDDYVRDETNRYRPAFTGAFIGICCQDLTGNGVHADFDWFDYKGLD